jgi:hypothetical protein
MEYSSKDLLLKVLLSPSTLVHFILLIPGTVYDPFEPIFFQSIGNKFILKRKDHCYIDGNDRFLSKYIFQSCVKRNGIFKDKYLGDFSWLNFKQNDEKLIQNPLSIGHYINRFERILN